MLIKPPAREIVSIRFGSHLYGTNTPASDEDFKSVFIPSGRDILLQRVQGSISTQRPKGEGEKNVAGELDHEAYSIQRYLGLCAEGQTVALDMLFAPQVSFLAPGWEWYWIKDNTHRLVTKKHASFVGYCRTQANKYGIKGSRVAAARTAYEFLQRAQEKLGTTEKLGSLTWEIDALSMGNEYMQVLDIEGATDVNGIKKTVRHWEVCNRKMPYTQTIKGACEVMHRIVKEYGHRALQAERNEGIDWKALSHAVRVGNQAIELLGTGRVEFPLANREHLKDIKLGKLQYAEVAEEIEDLLVRVEEAAAASTLRDEPDYAWIDATVAEFHEAAVRNAKS
jgi:RNA repair pathway DNA polymerase beta family protein